MDSAYSKQRTNEASLFEMLEKHSEPFHQLEDIFAWCRASIDTAAPDYRMRFDTRLCPGSDRVRGTHAKLSALVTDVKASGACTPAAVLEAVREHSFGEGQWLKVAGGGKANLIE